MPIKFKNQALPSFVKGSVSRSMFPPISPSLLNVAGRAGSYDFGNVIGNRQIIFDYFILYTTKADLMNKMRQFAEWLYSESSEKLEFTSDPDRYYYAKVTGETTYSEDNKVGKGTITFNCTDPYIYGAEKTQQLSTDGATTVTNHGGVEACPVMDITFKQDTTIFSLDDGNNRMVFGEAEQTGGTTTPVPKRVALIEDGLDTTNGWTSPVKVDNLTFDGSISSVNGVFRLTSVGSGRGWHGGALVKGLGEEVQDFTCETFVYLDATSINQLASIQIYLYDKSDVIVGKLSFSDYQSSMNDPIFEARTGTNSFASSYKQVKKGYYANKYVRLTLQRIGSKWFAEIAKRDAKKNIQYDKFSKTFVGSSSNKVSKIQVAILGYGKYPLNSNTGIESIYFYKENTLDDSVQIPVIFKERDNLIIDSERGIVTLNGDPCFDLLDGFSSFPILKKGMNHFTLFPVGEGTIKYRERWLS
ncbi:distal tail protein Dit [Thermoactinomyces sp. DSM 45892]|uniref:distal tail protein Dit n=1 Tax=Thermoactinomyces sp. DSM 45892 TaxID=1882753 RepID=UPI00089A245F|nr:distal tail protein Dit [Thermoactinomyces sp. DSM 45892]SDY69655.1 putative phage tail component, N-terminal domain-containing protein [Thermoactinomyces sp. DSM 45892]